MHHLKGVFVYTQQSLYVWIDRKVNHLKKLGSMTGSVIKKKQYMTQQMTKEINENVLS